MISGYYANHTKGVSFFVTEVLMAVETLICVVMILLLIRFLFSRRPGLVMTYSGFTCWYFNATTWTFCWNDVQRIEFSAGPLGKFGPGRFVNVYLCPGHGAEGRRSKLKALHGSGDVIIEHRFLTRSAQEIFESMKAYWTASKDQTARNELSNYPRP